MRVPVEYPQGSQPLEQGRPGSAEQVAQLVQFLSGQIATVKTYAQILVGLCGLAGAAGPLRAQWLLDLHSMHEPGQPLSLAGLQGRNLALARAMRAPEHIVVDAGHKDGVRMRDYGRFGLPDDQAGDPRSLLIECGFHGDPASLQVAQDQCVRFIEQSGVISAAVLAQQLPGWRLPDAPRQWALEVTQPVVARSAAFRFVEPFTGLECIEKQGTVIGDNDGEPVLTPYDDCVLVMPSTRQAQNGVTVVRYARRTLL